MLPDQLGGEKRGVRSKMADAAADIEGRGFSQTAKDLFSGAAGGIAQVLIGESDISFFQPLWHVQSWNRSSVTWIVQFEPDWTFVASGIE